VGVLARVLGEEGEAHEENADAGLDDRVAAEQPAADGREKVAWRSRADAIAAIFDGVAADGSTGVGAMAATVLPVALTAAGSAAAALAALGIGATPPIVSVATAARVVAGGDIAPSASCSVDACSARASRRAVASTGASARLRSSSISRCWRSERRISQPNSAPASAPASPPAAAPTSAPETIAISSRIMSPSRCPKCGAL
jgi:hypothetical protein